MNISIFLNVNHVYRIYLFIIYDIFRYERDRVFFNVLCKEKR